MMSNKILSISVAAYNVEKWLRGTLESCIINDKNQEYLEVIIVNDGSSDDTYNIALEYQNKYPELFKVVNKKNGGYGSTINSAVKVAEGKYFKILDGDDWYNTKELSCFIDRLKMCDEDVVFTNYVRVNENNEELDRISIGECIPNIKYDFMSKNKINWAMHGISVKTNLMRRHEIKISEHCFYTDAEFVTNVMRYMETYRFFDYYIYRYRVGRNGQSVSREGLTKHKQDSVRVLKKELELYNEIGENEKKRKIIGNYIIQSARFALNGYLISIHDKDSKSEWIELDLWIKENFPEIYNEMEKKKEIWLMRKLKYNFFILFRFNALRKFK